MLVKNVHGTSQNYPRPVCGCSSWIEHWSVNKGLRKDYKPLYCKGCGLKVDQNHIVGAHVKKVNVIDSGIYIIPFCDRCNKSEFFFNVNENDLISANCSKCVNR